MKDVYEKCPVLENNHYLLRLVAIEDTKALLKVYSDEKAVPYFNSDNCNGDDFFYKTFERMEKAIKYWIWEYDRKGFVRWSVIDKISDEAIGTIELFNRGGKDYSSEDAILRLDLRSDYEKADSIFEILSIIINSTYDLFHCSAIMTKAVPLAVERIKALKLIGFKSAEQELIGHDGTKYGDYWVCHKK
jgi:RimJ/RimL family protein N-acetyltransferase